MSRRGTLTLCIQRRRIPDPGSVKHHTDSSTKGIRRGADEVTGMATRKGDVAFKYRGISLRAGTAPGRQRLAR
jgi:hypothetical protein